ALAGLAQSIALLAFWAGNRDSHATRVPSPPAVKPSALLRRRRDFIPTISSIIPNAPENHLILLHKFQGPNAVEPARASPYHPLDAGAHGRAGYGRSIGVLGGGAFAGPGGRRLRGPAYGARRVPR